MHEDELWMDLSRPDLNNTECKILETLAEIGSGNAYHIWKKSELKHYPTILRSLKTLEKKEIVTTTETAGIRSKRQYKLTLLGETFYCLRTRNKKRLYAMFSENSIIFRDIVSRKFDADEVAHDTIRWVLLQSEFPDKYPQLKLDQIVHDWFDERLKEDLRCVEFADSENDFLRIAKIPWVKKLALQELNTEINYVNSLLKKYDDLKKSLSVE